MMVNNNCYTNYIAKMTFKTTCEVLKNMKKEAPVRLGDLKSKVTLLDNELDLWLQLAEKMYIPKNETTGIYEQHDGFFKLHHIDVDKIPVTDFPLYHNWSYDRIYRNDMIKQPDVLMFMFLYSQQFSLDEKAANYLYYEPRCIHESSLSPSVHSILASEIGFHREAYEFFEFATRMDLDNYNRNTNEGLHTTSIAAAWMNIVYGFAGMRSDGEELILNPSIPQKWDSYSFYLTYRGARIKVTVNKENVCLCSDNPVEIVVYGDKCNITHKEFKISIPDNYKSII